MVVKELQVSSIIPANVKFTFEVIANPASRGSCRVSWSFQKKDSYDALNPACCSVSYISAFLPSEM
jgi:hypothetical protein